MPLVSVALAAIIPPPHTTEATTVSAPTQLANSLAAADSIDSVVVDRAHHTVTFSIDRGGEGYDIVATTTRRGAVVAVTLRDTGHAGSQLGGLSWLADAMRETASVTHLTIDDDGAVTLVTNDGLRYMAIPGRGSGGNAAVEARWAAAWNDA